MNTIKPVQQQSGRTMVKPRTEPGAPAFIRNVSGMDENAYAMDEYVPGFSDAATILPKHAPNGGIRKSENPYGEVVMGNAFIGGGEGLPPDRAAIKHRLPKRKPRAGVDVKMDEDIVAAVVDPATMTPRSPEPMYQYKPDPNQPQSQHQHPQQQYSPQPREQVSYQPPPQQRPQQQYYHPEPPPIPTGAIPAFNQGYNQQQQPGMPPQQQQAPQPITDYRGSSKIYNPPPAPQYAPPQQQQPQYAPPVQMAPVPAAENPPAPTMEDVMQYIKIPRKRIRVRISHENFGNYRGNYVYVMENSEYLVLFYDIEEAGYEPPRTNAKDGPMTVSCEDKKHKVYYLGMDFDFGADNLAMQIYIKHKEQ